MATNNIYMLTDLLKEVQNIEINVGDKTYKISTKIKFLCKMERNYAKYINNGERMTFFKILKENFEFIPDTYFRLKRYKEMKEDKEKDKITRDAIISVAINDAFEQIDLYALLIILYSLIDDDELTFEQFQEFGIEDFKQNDIFNIFKNAIKDISPESDGNAEKK